MLPSQIKQSPLFSPLSIALTVIFVVGLGASLFVFGGAVFNPGEVTSSAQGSAQSEFASHVEFENQCSLCHQPLKSDQAALCVKCHTGVDDQLAGAPGTHGLIKNARQCATCHREHQGRAFDPISAALDEFDHGLTHFPLDGKHAALPCADCHTGGTYTLVYVSCAACHTEPVVHAGLFAQDCGECHNSAGWSPALVEGKPFDHDATIFTLARHAGTPAEPIRCNDCHAASDVKNVNPQCVDCHSRRDGAFMTDHTAAFGLNCLGCHDGADRLGNFKHETVFPLDGAHGSLQCAACHAEQRFRGTPQQCSGCHLEPEIHAGSFGTECQLCHTTTAWQPALMTAHPFPLDHGGQGEVACATCHAQNYGAYTCYGCHEHQADNIAREHREQNLSTERLNDCIACHADGRSHDD